MEMKQRIIGLVVLLALAVILVPLIFDSEVALPPPNQLALAPATKTNVSTTAQGVVAYQAPTIKPAQVQNAAGKVLGPVSQEAPAADQPAYDEHEDLGSSTEDQTQALEDEDLETPKPNLKAVPAHENVLTVSGASLEQSSNKIAAAKSALQEHPLSKAAALTEETLPSEPPKNAMVNDSTQKSVAPKDDMVRETALKLAIAKEDSIKGSSSAKLATAKEARVKLAAEKPNYLKVSSEKSAKQAKSVNIASKLHRDDRQNPGVWVVQLGSFSDISNAKKLVSDLKSKGFNAFAQSDDSRKNVHRVFIGPEHERATAEKTVAHLQDHLHIQGIIVRYRR
jgi:cell division septation protein DedD